MAAVVRLVFVSTAIWTAVSFVVAVVIGHALRRMQPIPVRTATRRIR
jgi:putative solute:sodium symporter small subunit